MMEAYHDVVDLEGWKDMVNYAKSKGCKVIVVTA